MRRTTAALGTLLFFLVAPTTVTGLVPFLMTGWKRVHPLPLGTVQQIAGAILIFAGAGVLIHSFVRFAVEGFGTPAPIAPPSRLVIGGLYRYVRNPIYVALLAIVLGQAIALGQTSLVVYAAVLAVAFFAFVRLYEEPTLASKFGDEYEAYRKAVPGWLPRLRPWRP